MRNIKSILLVDDDRDDQYFFYKALEEADASVELTAASDGADAFEKLKTFQPDIILLDLVMPVMNGVTFLNLIKSQNKLKHIPVFVYTTDLSIFREKEVLALGAEDILIKPTDFTATVAIIRDLLQRNDLRQSA
jgi:CheY-like chemotaxis protein